MTEEDQFQLVSQLRTLALGNKVNFEDVEFPLSRDERLEAHTKWVVYSDLADIIETLRNP